MIGIQCETIEEDNEEKHESEGINDVLDKSEEKREQDTVSLLWTADFGSCGLTLCSSSSTVFSSATSQTLQMILFWSTFLAFLV